jgi:Tfp pilus assembly protein PilO|tara:strand:- start:495 stop:1052 length:558 start_codon:yes stop_codon:yes gene_type:complete
MTATLERWMLLGTFILSVLFISFFILPNYKSAKLSYKESKSLEERIQQLELRQTEVELMRSEYQDLKKQVDSECKRVPSTPDMSQIVQALSLNVDGHKVLDQSFTSGTTSVESSERKFSAQPLAVTLCADFESIFSVIQNVESMDRLVRISSVRVTRKESESDVLAPALEAAIGLHAMYDIVEVE